MKIVILGLSITSSWGNGHATTYRALVRSLVDRGHDVLFLERDVPWYAAHRDLPDPPMGRTRLYTGLTDLVQRFTDSVAEADLVIVGSFVPEGVAVGRWVVATARGITGFYDIDTPVTLAKLARGDHEYLHPDLIGRFDMYLSFTAGPTLREIEQRYGSPCALPLFCSVDVRDHHPLNLPVRWDLTYMGTYSADRQPGLERLLVGPAMRMSRGRFAVAGSLYPSEVRWPVNVMRIEHLPPRQHSAFYCRSRFTLNLTREDMIKRGYSPSVRLFEAAACGTPILSDHWPGLSDLLEPGREVLIVHSTQDVMDCLRDIDEPARLAMAHRARQRIITQHSSQRRALELEQYVAQVARKQGSKKRAPTVMTTTGALHQTDRCS